MASATTLDTAPSRTYRFKVLLVGDQGVGKSSIFNYFASQPDAPKTPRPSAVPELPTTPRGNKDHCYKDVVISGKTIRVCGSYKLNKIYFSFNYGIIILAHSLHLHLFIVVQLQFYLYVIY